jgi:hypothetical protein
MQPVSLTRPSLVSTPHDLCDDVTYTTCSRASNSLEVRLGNPSLTSFHVKQAARSQCVSRADLLPSVLWRNQQTEASLVLRPKPRNHRDDFESQITKPELPILRPKSGNLSHRFCGQTGRNCLSGLASNH